MPDITQKRLKELISYDGSTGVFTWISTARTGKTAGSIQQGYLAIQVDRKIYRAHRLAWLYEYGHFPPDCIDHINHVRNDNRIYNLRSVSKLTNAKNQRVAKNNTSGVVGVRWIEGRNRWEASIRVNYKLKYLGYFSSISEAKDAREGAQKMYGFHENHGKTLLAGGDLSQMSLCV